MGTLDAGASQGRAAAASDGLLRPIDVVFVLCP